MTRIDNEVEIVTTIRTDGACGSRRQVQIAERILDQIAMLRLQSARGRSFRVSAQTIHDAKLRTTWSFIAISVSTPSIVRPRRCRPRSRSHRCPASYPLAVARSDPEEATRWSESGWISATAVAAGCRSTPQIVFGSGNERQIWSLLAKARVRTRTSKGCRLWAGPVNC